MELRGSGRCILILSVFIAISISFSSMPLAASLTDGQKYQVVNGSNDNAYLVNTTTGFVWILTYRTMATGREPIAIPYKFIKICPKQDKEFIVEDAKGNFCLPGK